MTYSVHYLCDFPKFLVFHKGFKRQFFILVQSYWCVLRCMFIHHLFVYLFDCSVCVRGKQWRRNLAYVKMILKSNFAPFDFLIYNWKCWRRAAHRLLCLCHCAICNWPRKWACHCVLHNRFVARKTYIRHCFVISFYTFAEFAKHVISTSCWCLLKCVCCLYINLSAGFNQKLRKLELSSLVSYNLRHGMTLLHSYQSRLELFQRF